MPMSFKERRQAGDRSVKFAYFHSYRTARAFSDNTPGAGLPTTGTTAGQYGGGALWTVAYPSDSPMPSTADQVVRAGQGKTASGAA